MNLGSFSLSKKFAKMLDVLLMTFLSLRISDKLLEEMLSTVLAELDFGEKSFVESFLRHELDR